MDSCVFCEIIEGKAEASVVHEDATCTAFMDIRPVNSGHMLIVPKTHAAQLNDLDEEVGAQLFRVAIRLDKALRKSGLRCEGVNLFLADGEAAGQDVFHVHLHIFPRFADDGFGLIVRPRYGEKSLTLDLVRLCVVLMVRTHTKIKLHERRRTTLQIARFAPTHSDGLYNA